MLEPRGADIPVLFLVLVVLPLVAYILLGKWSESAKKRERISLLAQLAAEEAFRAEVMATACIIPPMSTSKNGIHVCARCFSPATTRCSRCKSVRYCSGKCQIIHWRQAHKEECQRLETTSSCSSPMATSCDESIPEKLSINDGLDLFSLGYNSKQPAMDTGLSDNNVHPLTSTGACAAGNCPATVTSQEAMLHRRSPDKQVSCKSNKEMYCGSSSSLNAGKYGINAREIGTNFVFNVVDFSNAEASVDGEMAGPKCYYETPVTNGNVKANTALHPMGNKSLKSSKSKMKFSGDQSYFKIDGKGQLTDDSKVARMRNANPAAGTNGVTSIGIMKMMDLRKSSKLATQDITEVNATHKKLRMLFPYEEFVNIFNCEVIDLTPRGLVNCGNSCYANAVLQCLTCTKPLIVFLLHRSHSRACCEIDWCLMCELEQHVMMLRECGGPLSPSRILLHMRNINHQIGDGSQEDAHEFLRLLIASMQSICLEKLGGEDKVDPRLQETTFIQHTFGGRLRSKVKCLRCHHESERYENIMDLTLEIFGWVKSLEDALTQFTTPEELDGENMYRCGRCAAYVRARKQLSIHEAPNILTIVLKRFQEGKYGKINKCITFPDMLDMIPFMTGTGDVPPLYMLYAVVVHLDTLNASFSGHYVAYVKDLQGSWFRIDDTEVHPVSMSQVMLEGAYILFYTRSCPRPQKAICEKASRQQVPLTLRHCMSRTQKPSRQGQSKCSSHFVGPEASLDVKPENGSSLASYANGIPRSSANKNTTQVMDFSDATSSDRSLFTSSDEASFTTESTRDSFSTIDYADACNADAFSSIFNDLYAPESSYQNSLCR
uniref:ubiquitinyl hydrolase 1 n=1 Tax=Populus trichocarpa TaxID=3694 RepID=A0A2K1YHV6_POPTR|eukprot:XP_002317364.2 ubiquitin carboxyl-terminal hydrolase 15 isoform X1 [Populus trichocarpa]